MSVPFKEMWKISIFFAVHLPPNLIQYACTHQWMKSKQKLLPLQLKPRMVMTPLAISPPSSTPEPDMSSIPQDAATIPHSATPQVLTGTKKY